MMINKLEKGKRVFNVASGDGRANPLSYLLELQGEVTTINDRFVEFGRMMVTRKTEEQFLKPNVDGFCYYVAELDGMDSYKLDEKFYKVPARLLLEHMSSYVSPW